MTRINKVNKRSIKKSTPVAEVTETAKPFPDEPIAFSYRELQAETKRLGLKASGSKSDLIDRINNA